MSRRNRLFLVIAVLLSVSTNIALGQTIPTSLETITRDNASQLTQMAVLGRGTMETLAWSPDGATLAVGGSLGVWLYDAESFTAPSRLLEERNGAIEDVAFNADSTGLIASNEHSVRLWDVKTESTVSVIMGSVIVGYPESVYDVAVNHDGTMLALVTWDGIHLRDVATRTDVAVWTEDYLRPVDRIAFSPDDKTLAIALYNDHTIRLWDVATGTEIAMLTGHTDRIADLAFSRDGTRLASSDASRTAWLWDLTTHDAIAPLDAPAISLAFSPDSNTLAIASISVILWDIEARSQIMNLPMNESHVKDVVFSPDGRMLAAGDSTTVRVWDTTTGSEIGILEGYRDGVRSIAFSPDGVMLASASADGLVQLWDVRAEADVASFRQPPGIAILAFNSDGSLLAGGDIVGTIYVWDAGSKRLILQLDGHPTHVDALAFSPNDAFLASSGWDDPTVHLWDLESGDEAIRIETDTVSVLVGLTFNPDGTILAYSLRDEVHLWDVASQADFAVLESDLGGFSVDKLVSSPDGNTLAIGYWGGVRFWDITSLTEVGRVDAGPVTDIAYSPNGSMLAVGTETRVIQIVDVAARERILFLEGHSRGSTLLKEWVWSVAFNPDGSLLASSAEDGTIRLWGVPTA